jgi:predicted N-formylglutamate amidohydrolase
MKKTAILLTCEHGGNEIPPEYETFFEGHHEIVRSHRGWDPGALELTLSLAELLDSPVYYSEISRLLVELNRSEHHPALFSSFIKKLPPKDRDSIKDTYYHPFRNRVVKHISQAVQTGCYVIHLSVHSFSAELNGIERNADIGLLYDPARHNERKLAVMIAESLKESGTELRVRMNYPYRGKSDGHITSLRKKFGSAEYAGIELEVNQKLLVPALPTLPVLPVLPGTAELHKLHDEAIEENGGGVHRLIGEAVKKAIYALEI